mgnify:FL=1
MREELIGFLGIGKEALRRRIKDGKFPPPDFVLSLKRVGWKQSTLRKVNLILPDPASRPMPEPALSAD